MKNLPDTSVSIASLIFKIGSALAHRDHPMCVELEQAPQNWVCVSVIVGRQPPAPMIR